MDGRLFQLIPSTLRHAVISVNVSAAISKKTEADCFANWLRVLVAPGSFIAYPDMNAVVGEIATNAAKGVLLNPTFLLEVVSPRTGEHDRGFKAFLYRAMPSLQEFLLVDEMSVFVDRYTCQREPVAVPGLFSSGFGLLSEGRGPLMFAADRILGEHRGTLVA